MKRQASFAAFGADQAFAGLAIFKNMVIVCRMTPAARIQSLIEIYERIAIAPVPMDTVMGDYLRGRKYIGAKDRKYIVETAYTIMRHYGRITWVLDQLGHDKTPRTIIIIGLRLNCGPEPVEGPTRPFESRSFPQQSTEIESLFSGNKYAPAQLTETERTLIQRDLAFDKMPDHVRVECPDKDLDRLKNRFGHNFEAEMTALLTPATLDLRVNSLKASRDRVQELLKTDKVQTTYTPYAPYGLRVDGKAFLSKTRAFVKGWFDIQDEGSQLIAEICDVQPGMQVLDYCAGAGGKTLALANRMQGKGRIVAMDTEISRLNRSTARFKRAKVSDMIERRVIGEPKNRRWIKRQTENFDVVLCDVPCTGSGTWRRNPDYRWRRLGPSLEELTEVQADILDKVAHTVKPGGVLVYATCSFFVEENDRQVERFLKDHPEFDYGESSLPAELMDGPYMKLSPHKSNTDGFFACRLIRKI